MVIFYTYITPFVIFDGGGFNYFYNYAILAWNVELIANVIIIIFVMSISQKNINHFVLQVFELFKIHQISVSFTYFVAKKRWKSISIFFYLCFVFFLFLVSYDCGFINWIQDPRTGYQVCRSGKGLFYALSITFLSMSLVFATIFINLSKIKTASILFFYLYSFYLLGSKSFVAAYVIYVLSYFWLFKIRHYSILAFLFGVSGASVLLILHFAAYGSDLGFLDSFYSYFDLYINSARFYEYFEDNSINHYLGEIFLSKVWSFVPRILYDDKPYVYGQLILNELFWPGYAELGTTPAFGGPVTTYADFGFTGIFLMGIFNPVKISYLIFLRFLLSNLTLNALRSDKVVFLIFIWYFAPGVFSYIPLFISLLMAYFLLAYLLTIKLKVVVYRSF